LSVLLGDDHRVSLFLALEVDLGEPELSGRPEHVPVVLEPGQAGGTALAEALDHEEKGDTDAAAVARCREDARWMAATPS
jgi:hypothetical protein